MANSLNHYGTHELNGESYRPGAHALISRDPLRRLYWHVEVCTNTDNSALGKMESSSEIIRQCAQHLLQAAEKIAVTSETTTLRHPCIPQTNHYSTTRTDKRQGQRPTSRQRGSGVQNQVY